MTQTDLSPLEILRSLGINGTLTVTPVQGGFDMIWKVEYEDQAYALRVYAWAGTVLQHDLAQGYKHLPQELTPARRWTNKWKARAGGSGFEM